ncbi:hypothetical protein TcBrA4_0105560 [Trypanosoma cruzi]|nr:hypothetical protein TcBrA4_0105560 [Trypanosoma cruzi]
MEPRSGALRRARRRQGDFILEKVPRHARGEVRRSACRLSTELHDRFAAATPVDITRGGDVHKNPGPRRMATSIFGGLTLQASRP